MQSHYVVGIIENLIGLDQQRSRGYLINEAAGSLLLYECFAYALETMCKFAYGTSRFED